MSCYNWESGTLKLPAKDYVMVRNAVIEAHNDRLIRAHERALRVYQRLHDLLGGRRGIDWDQFMRDDFYREQKGFRRDDIPEFHGADDDLNYLVWNSLFPYERDRKKKRTRPKKPAKKAFAPLKKTATTVTFDETSIVFDPKARTVEWDVSENNRAVEHAREHAIGRAFFRALGRVNWTPRTGGVIVGNDEYSRGDQSAGGGANYVTARYGGLGKKAEPWSL